jgi:hypothetical protein
MGIDIGIAVYDEKREKRYKLVEAVLKGFEYADDEMKAECPFDIEAYRKEERTLRHAKYDAKPPKHLKWANEFRGERWWNLGISINQYMEFKLEPEVYFPDQMIYIINPLALFVRVPEVGTPDYKFVKARHDLFVEMKDNNLMLFPC